MCRVDGSFAPAACRSLRRIELIKRRKESFSGVSKVAKQLDFAGKSNHEGDIRRAKGV